jgi:hypothetical protein
VGDCATQKMRFKTTPLALEAAFDGGKLTSDGGLIWLANQRTTNSGICARGSPLTDSRVTKGT